MLIGSEKLLIKQLRCLQVEVALLASDSLVIKPQNLYICIVMITLRLPKNATRLNI